MTELLKSMIKFYKLFLYCSIVAAHQHINVEACFQLATSHSVAKKLEEYEVEALFS